VPKIVDKAAQRQNIALAACRAVAHNGIDATTMVDIAREAGVTTGMITHYFGSKNDIIHAALRLVLERMEARIQARIGGQSETLYSILKEMLPIDQARQVECAIWISFWGKVSSDPKLCEVNRELHEYAENLYRHAVVYTWPEARQWSPVNFETVTSSILIFLNGLTASAITSPQSWDTAAQLKALDSHLKLLEQWIESSVSSPAYSESSLHAKLR